VSGVIAEVTPLKTRNLFIGLLLVTAFAMQAAVAFSRGSVTVVAHGPAGLRIEGKSSKLALEQDASVLRFTVPIAPIETGIDLRDRHLRELLEAEKFPAAVLRVARSELNFPKDREAAEGTARGELTLHGRSRPVEIRYRAEMVAFGITKIRGSVQLDMRDFEIHAPSYFGVTVAPEVQVELELAVTGAWAAGTIKKPLMGLIRIPDYPRGGLAHPSSCSGRIREGRAETRTLPVIHLAASSPARLARLAVGGWARSRG
jgi:hypothetical protein